MNCVARPTIDISPSLVRNWLLAILFGLVAADYFLVFLDHGLRIAVPEQLASRLDSNVERSLPTLFNVGLLILAAVACSLTGALRAPRRGAWRLLAAVFVYLAIDEALSIHEGLSPRVRDLLGTSGFFHFAWIIPYGLACVLLFLVLVPWLRDLPSATLVGFILSAALYLTGALVLDAASGAYLSANHIESDLVHDLATGLEEGLEMLGLILFVYHVLKYARSLAAAFDVRILGDGA
jgi:hypothetical protein